MTERRYDLDWLRIIAFGLLIFYHCGMFYVTWDWHVKSDHASDAIEPLMMLTNPWRLTLLFLIAGAATPFLADKVSVWKFTGSRMGRLWPPLLLAVFVIVPPQAYYEVLDAIRLGQLPASDAWLDNFYVKYVTGSGNWCDAEGCLTTPTYNHMWFVAFLILYTLALIPLLPLLRRLPNVSALIAGPLLVLTPWAVQSWTESKVRVASENAKDVLAYCKGIDCLPPWTIVFSANGASVYPTWEPLLPSVTPSVQDS